MVSFRDQNGHRISRLAVQLDPTHLTKALLSAVEQLRLHVDVLKVVSSDTPLFRFTMRDVWKTRM